EKYVFRLMLDPYDTGDTFHGIFFACYCHLPMILFLRREKMKLSSLEKSLILIETLAEHPRGLTLSRLSELCGQPVSSIHHALSTFRERGFVAQNEETKKYSLGLKFLTIS